MWIHIEGWVLINQVKWKWDEKGYRQSSLCDKGPEPKKATFVKGNRCKISVPRAQHKIIMYFPKKKNSCRGLRQCSKLWSLPRMMEMVETNEIRMWHEHWTLSKFQISLFCKVSKYNYFSSKWWIVFYHFLVILISYLISSHCQKYSQSTTGSTYNIERESNYRNV